MFKDSSVHKSELQNSPFFKNDYPEGATGWRAEQAPDIENGIRTGSLCGCNYCGSMHPSDVAKAIKAGANIGFADFKYGWPHKAYLEKIPNPHAGLLESRCSKSSVSEEEKANGEFIEIPTGKFDTNTGKPTTTWTEKGKPASNFTYGKFYTIHLQDASDEDRETIESALNTKFEFKDGKVFWEKVR